MSESTAETHVNGRFKPGASGNPVGRPKGAKNKATLLAEEAMEEKVGAVVGQLVERALAGNLTAIRQFLDRTMPVPRGCCRFDLPDLRAPRGIADAQEALIVVVAAGQVLPRDAERVMKLIDRFEGTLRDEMTKAQYAALDAARQQRAPAEAAPEPAAAAPDLTTYARMEWPELIDAMWDAEEEERKAASVRDGTPPIAVVPAATHLAEDRASDAGDATPDSDCPVDAPRVTADLIDAKHDIYREIQAGADCRPLPSAELDQAEAPAGPGESPHPAVVFDETVPPPWVDMSGQASIRRFRAAGARQMGHRGDASAAYLSR